VKKYTLILMGLVTLGMVALTVADQTRKTNADQKRKSKGQRPLATASIPREQNTGKAIPPLPILMEARVPAFAVDVDSRKNKGPGILPIHQKLADRLSKVEAVPADRLRHYQWLNNGDFQLLGWHGFVDHAEPIPGGYLVTLRISPRVRSKFGASTTVFDKMYEKYTVVGDQVEFVEAIHPPGSGQPSFVTD